MKSIDPIKPKRQIKSSELKRLKDKLLVQRKYNGCRCTSTTTEEGSNLWSRSLSKKNNERIPYTGKMPHIMKELEEWNLPAGTILDGELVSFRGGVKENFKDIKQSTGGYDETNVKFQKDTGHYATWMVFDIVYYNNREVWRLPFSKRLEILKRLFEDQKLEWIKLVKTEKFKGTLKDYKDRATRNDWEGFVIKNEDSIYGQPTSMGKTARPSDTWWKIKSEKIADVFITGFEYGKEGTKNETKVGKLVCWQYDKQGKKHQVCKVGTGFSEMEREWYLHQDYSEPLIGMVQYAYRNENHKLVHPSWKGLRYDKAQKECIIED